MPGKYATQSQFGGYDSHQEVTTFERLIDSMPKKEKKNASSALKMVLRRKVVVSFCT
tara:strand:+ start:515 stop:685 length:171 start_codon:yes stop_codon:yes gene_type:complete